MSARERLEGNSAVYRRTIKLAPAIGDWTTLRPIKMPSKKIKTGLSGFDRLSQEQLRLVQTIHYNFGEMLTASLRKNLSAGTDFFSITVEQSTYSEFLKKVYQPAVYCKLSVPGFQNELIFSVDMPIANTIINHALGGQDLSPITRKLTDIEEEVFMNVFSPDLSNFAKAFENVFDMPSLKIISSPEISVETSLSPTSTFVFLTLEISIGDNPPASIWIGYTPAGLKTLLEKVEARLVSRPVNLAKLPPVLLDNLTIPIVVDLGTTSVATQDLHRLEEGDVVSLDASLSESSRVGIGEGILLFGQPGVKGGRFATRLFLSRTSIKQSFAEEIPVAKGDSGEKPENIELEKEGKEEYSTEEPVLEDIVEGAESDVGEEPLTEDDFKI